MKRIFPIAAAVILLGAIWAFFFSGGTGGLVEEGTAADLAIVSGSENRALEPIIAAWAEDNGHSVRIDYLGSVDISRELERGRDGAYDAVWPANSLWIELGDSHKVVKHRESILRSPVVLGLRRSIAERLGWTGRDDVTVQEIADAASAGEFRLSMTSATQSNSGASAYFGFLYAFAGSPDVLTLAHLEDDAVRQATADLLAATDRSSGSSGWLGEALRDHPDRFDAMFNYEAVVLETNQALVAKGQEPLYLIYPANGLSVADSPLGYVDKGDADREAAFLALQEHLLTTAVQDQLRGMGRRTGLIGLAGGGDPAVWNPAWGVDLSREIAPVPTPSQEVIREALRLYQTDLRKPSLTIWLLDVSGSMEGTPLDQLKEASRLLFDPEQAGLSLLQPSGRDVTVVIPFSGDPQQPIRVDGNADADLRELVRKINGLRAGGGTDIYLALVRALALLDEFDQAGTLFDHLPAIVVMTDGVSSEDNKGRFESRLSASRFGRDIPIHAIAFGDADESQLKELAAASIGRLFDARKDLAGALRSAKGYN